MQIRERNIDIALIGAGIMSTTIGVLFKQLASNANIKK
jgi:L-2-hydroxyglutarate oxidase LhgO